MKIIKYLLPIFTLYFLAWHFQIGINLTNSLPQGLYIVDKNQEIQHGDIVKLCLNEYLSQKTNAELYVGYGTCKNGLKPLLKYVVGLEGDLVNVRNNKVFIHSKHTPLSTVMHIKDKDSQGKKVNSIIETGIIPTGKAFLYSYHGGSFDSRYFGLVDTSDLTHMKELFIF